LSFDATWTDPSGDGENMSWSRSAWQSVAPRATGRAYLNFPGFSEEREDLVRSAYGDNYERLVELKTAWDPGNVFRFNQNIKPRQ
jgi:FAD/FMN-containing dehydrogenase